MKVILRVVTLIFVFCGAQNINAGNYPAYQQQTNTYTGTVNDNFGAPLLGASVLVKGTTRGTTTDENGQYSINARPGEVLVLSYLGFISKEVNLGANTNLGLLNLQEDDTVLNVVEIVGIRKSIKNAIELKRKSSTIIEAIAPQDLGNFSDESILDALQRVPGVQVQSGDGGIDGGRVSIRGIGPQFVVTTFNGRQPVGGGAEGLREFNQSVFPPEVLNGAEIYKASEAKLVEGGIGGLINYSTVRPLDAQYNEGSNIFAVVNARHNENVGRDDAGLNHRLSAIIGGRTKDKKLGAYISVLSSEDQTYGENASAVITAEGEFDLRVDRNQNGIYDPNIDNPELGDITIPGVIFPSGKRASTFNRDQERLAIAAGIQWKPIKELEVNLDFSYLTNDFETEENANSSLLALTGGFRPQDYFPYLSTDGLWQPNAFSLSSDNVLNFVNTSGIGPLGATYTQRLENRIRERNLEDYLGGVNAKYQSGDWTFIADIGYSTNDVFAINLPLLRGQQEGLEGIIIDNRSSEVGTVQYLNADHLDPAAYGFRSDIFYNFNGSTSSNYSGRIDINKKIGARFSVDVGYRYSASEIRARTIRRVRGFTDEHTDALEALLGNASVVNIFSDFNLGAYNQILNSNIDDAIAIYQQFTPEVLNQNSLETSLGDSLFNVPIAEQLGDEECLLTNTNRCNRIVPAQSYDFEEATTAFYGQLNVVGDRNSTFVGNIGIRLVQTDYSNQAYSEVRYTNPDALTDVDDILSNNEFTPSTNSRNRWDYLPSLNATVRFLEDKNLQTRIAVSRTMSRPLVADLIPRNLVITVQPDSPILDPTSPFYNPNSEGSRLLLGNPDLEPYFSWNYDAVLEYYTKSGGAFVVTGFYKDIKGFIARRGVAGTDYPGNDIVGLDIPEQNQVLPYNIQQTQNFSDAKVYGFELGFNQPFTFLPGVFDGLGLQANYTYVTSEFDADVGDSDGGFPGSSKNNFNSILYYDKHGIGLRFTYAWRDEFITQLGDPANEDVSLRATRWREARGTFGIGGSYNFNKHLQLSVRGTNITGQDIRSFFGSDKSNFLSYSQLEPAWIFGLRYRL